MKVLPPPPLWTPRTRTAGISIHHATGPDDVPAAVHDAYHRRKRGWRILVRRADYEDGDPPEWAPWNAAGEAVIGLGYHVYIRSDGTVEQARPWQAIGAHCVAGGRNMTHLGVGLAGDRSLRPMPADQRASLVEVLAAMCGRFDLDPRAQTLESKPVIEPHCQAPRARTECPGRYVLEVLEEIRRDVADLLC